MHKIVISQLFATGFCLAVPKTIVGEPSCAEFQRISGREKVYGQVGSIVFRGKFLSHNTETSRRGTFLFFRTIEVSKNFKPRGGFTNSFENFVVSQYRRTS